MRRVTLVSALAALVALAAALPAVGGPATVGRSDVQTFSDRSVVGSSQLVRTASGISFSLRTSQLSPGSANTIWVVIFDNPSACADGCGADDLADPAVNGRAVWGAGNVSGNGTSGFAGHVPAGTYDDALVAKGGGGAATEFQNPLGAEVHLVVRTHGDLWPGNVADQLHSFGLGCNPACANVQFSVYLP